MTRTIGSGCDGPTLMAMLRSSIKRLLVKHGYPPDKRPAAIKLVMEQMESLAPHYVAVDGAG